MDGLRHMTRTEILDANDVVTALEEAEAAAREKAERKAKQPRT
jgi:hypothetical protein